MEKLETRNWYQIFGFFKKVISLEMFKAYSREAGLAGSPSKTVTQNMSTQLLKPPIPSCPKVLSPEPLSETEEGDISWEEHTPLDLKPLLNQSLKSPVRLDFDEVRSQRKESSKTNRSIPKTPDNNQL